MEAWLVVTVAAAIVALIELSWIMYERHSWVNPQLPMPEEETPHANAALSPVPGPSPEPTSGGVPLTLFSPPEASAHHIASLEIEGEEGVVYVDPQGRCTFADHAARIFLDWRTGELSLDDVLPGGRNESAAWLEALVRHGYLVRRCTHAAEHGGTVLEIRGVALRDRDENFWGAALFLRRPPHQANGHEAS